MRHRDTAATVTLRLLAGLALASCSAPRRPSVVVAATVTSPAPDTPVTVAAAPPAFDPCAAYRPEVSGVACVDEPAVAQLASCDNLPDLPVDAGVPAAGRTVRTPGRTWPTFAPVALAPAECALLAVQRARRCQATPGTAGHVAATYALARVLYQANHLDRAAPLFLEVARSATPPPGQDDLRPYAGDLALDSLNAMGASWRPPRPACFAVLATGVRLLLARLCPARTVEREDFCRRLATIDRQVQQHAAGLPRDD